jgi:hypothetical protein
MGGILAEDIPANFSEINDDSGLYDLWRLPVQRSQLCRNKTLL